MKRNKKTGIPLTIATLVIISAVLTPMIGIISENAEGLDMDLWYPVEVNIKVGYLPKSLTSTPGLGVRFPDMVSDQDAEYADYDDLNDYIYEQLENIEWRDPEHDAVSSNRAIIKLEVKNRISFSVSDISAVIQIPEDPICPTTSRPLVAYQSDASLEESYLTWDHDPGDADGCYSAVWQIPSLGPEDSLESFFISGLCGSTKTLASKTIP